jgi:hypothetical protein
MPSCLIRTCPTIGDNFYIQKILKTLTKYNFEVYCPLFHRNFWLAEYINYPGLNYNYADCDVTIEIANSVEENWPYDIMSSKYKMAKRTGYPFPEEILNLTDENWQDYFTFERKRDKEEELFNMLGCFEPYILVNRFYGEGQTLEVEQNIVDKSLKRVHMGRIGNYTLLDWCKVIENCKELHTVDTSINYLVEVLDMKTDILLVYARHLEHALKCLKPIFNRKNWNWY